MRAVDKRESLVVLFIVVASVLVFAFISRSAPHTQYIYPPQQTVLTAQDMMLTGPGGSITVGSTTYDEIKAVYPEGKDLGRSTIYHPAGLGLWLTTTRAEDVLIRICTTDPDIPTARGIKAGDSFEQVVASYGPNYSRAYTDKDPNKFDASYGSEQYILFRVEDNTVQQIMIGGPVDPDVQLALKQQPQ